MHKKFFLDYKFEEHSQEQVPFPKLQKEVSSESKTYSFRKSIENSTEGLYVTLKIYDNYKEVYRDLVTKTVKQSSNANSRRRARDRFFSGDTVVKELYTCNFQKSRPKLLSELSVKTSCDQRHSSASSQGRLPPFQLLEEVLNNQEENSRDEETTQQDYSKRVSQLFNETKPSLESAIRHLHVDSQMETLSEIFEEVPSVVNLCFIVKSLKFRLIKNQKKSRDDLRKDCPKESKGKEDERVSISGNKRQLIVF